MERTGLGTGRVRSQRHQVRMSAHRGVSSPHPPPHLPPPPPRHALPSDPAPFTLPVSIDTPCLYSHLVLPHLSLSPHPPCPSSPSLPSSTPPFFPCFVLTFPASSDSPCLPLTSPCPPLRLQQPPAVGSSLHSPVLSLLLALAQPVPSAWSVLLPLLLNSSHYTVGAPKVFVS